MELPVKALQHNHGHGSQDYFCNQLRIGKAIHGEDPIQKNQGRNLQNQLAQNREEQGNPSVSERLENADCEEIHPEKRKDQPLRKLVPYWMIVGLSINSRTRFPEKTK